MAAWQALGERRWALATVPNWGTEHTESTMAPAGIHRPALYPKAEAFAAGSTDR